MADVLKLETNVPQTIALAFADGLTMPSKFGGEQRMFSLVDGRKWFAAPYIADKLKNAGVVANQPFVICKRELVTGNRRVVEYQIETGSAATAPVSTASTSQQTVQVSPSHSIHAVPAPVAPAAPLVTSASGWPIAPAPTVDTSAAAIAASTGCAAVDAVLVVESYARSRGLTDFAFSPENIEKLWVTLFIDARKSGVRA